MSGSRVDARVVRAVFERVRARDLSVADLYAEDAYLCHHQRFDGREAIREFYASVIAIKKPYPIICGLWSSGATYNVLIETAGAEGPKYTVDTFEIRDGIIRSLRICPGGLEGVRISGQDTQS